MIRLGAFDLLHSFMTNVCTSLDILQYICEWGEFSISTMGKTKVSLVVFTVFRLVLGTLHTRFTVKSTIKAVRQTSRMIQFRNTD